MWIFSCFYAMDSDYRVIALIPDESEDMWHAYNLISEGDSVTASTVRKVQTESATGSSTSNRVRTTLTIKVETIDFDTQACVLRLKGRNIVENQYVKVKFFIHIKLTHSCIPNSWCCLFLTVGCISHIRLGAEQKVFSIQATMGLCSFRTSGTGL